MWESRCRYSIPAWYVDRSERLLLDTLDVLARLRPRDPFIAGQRVFYMVNAGDPARALSAARECAAYAWWCALLEGYAHAAAGATVTAEAAIDRAIAAMPAEVRCRWTGVAPIVAASERRRFSDPSCPNSDTDRRFWWLADPSFLVDGNDRRVAHFTRGITEELFTAWGDRRESENRFLFPDLRNEVLAEGWNDSWDSRSYSADAYQRLPRIRLPNQVTWTKCATRLIVMNLKQPNDNETLGDREFDRYHIGPPPAYPVTCVFGSNVGSRFHFVPDAAALDDPLDAPASAWRVGEPDPPERYTPAYGPVSTLADYQLAYFRRGDSALVLSVAAIDRDTMLARIAGDSGSRAAGEWIVGLVLSSQAPPTAPEHERRVIQRSPSLPSRIVLETSAPWSRHLASLEVLAPGPTGPRGLARVRLGIAPPVAPVQRVTMSDLLLVEAPASAAGTPRTLEAVRPRALGSTRLARERAVGLFWEVYGVTTGETAGISLAISEIDSSRGLFGRLTGMFGGPKPLREVRWSEHIERGATADRPWGGAVTLDLRDLEPGKTHRLELRIAVPGQAPVTVVRTIDIAG